MKSLIQTKKIICLVIATTIFVTQVADAQTLHLLQTTRGEIKAGLHFQLPENLGRIQEKIYPTSSDKPTVIHIHNAHANPQAMRQISAIVKELKEKTGANLLIAEGGDGILDATQIDFDSDRKKNRAILDGMIDKAQITAADLALWENKMHGFGAEDPKLYIDAYKAFVEVIQNRAESESELNQAFQQLEKGSSQVFSNDMRELVKTYRAYSANTRDFMAVIGYLSSESKKALDLDLQSAFSQFKWPMLARLTVLNRIEKSVDSAAYETEKAKLLEWLKAQKIDINLFLALERSDSSGASRSDSPEVLRSGREAYEAFLEKAWKKGYLFSDYKQVTYKLAQQILSKEVDAWQLSKEIEALFHQLADKTAQTPEAQKLWQAYQKIMLVEKLMRLELTREEWAEVQQYNVQRKAFSKLPHLNAAIKFYEINEKREDAFLKNLMQVLQKGTESSVNSTEPQHPKRSTLYDLRSAKNRIAILVTGGFHGEGMKERIAAQGLGYVSIMPHITDIGDCNLYHDVMLAQSQVHLRGVQGLHTPEVYSGSESAQLEALLAVLGKRSELRLAFLTTRSEMRTRRSFLTAVAAGLLPWGRGFAQAPATKSFTSESYFEASKDPKAMEDFIKGLYEAIGMKIKNSGVASGLVSFHQGQGTFKGLLADMKRDIDKDTNKQLFEGEVTEKVLQDALDAGKFGEEREAKITFVRIAKEVFGFKLVLPKSDFDEYAADEKSKFVAVTKDQADFIAKIFLAFSKKHQGEAKVGALLLQVSDKSVKLGAGEIVSISGERWVINSKALTSLAIDAKHGHIKITIPNTKSTYIGFNGTISTEDPAIAKTKASAAQTKAEEEKLKAEKKKYSSKREFDLRTGSVKEMTDFISGYAKYVARVNLEPADAEGMAKFYVLKTKDPKGRADKIQTFVDFETDFKKQFGYRSEMRRRRFFLGGAAAAAALLPGTARALLVTQGAGTIDLRHFDGAGFYKIQVSDDLKSWSDAATVRLQTASEIKASFSTLGKPDRFFRIAKVTDALEIFAHEQIERMSNGWGEGKGTDPVTGFPYDRWETGSVADKTNRTAIGYKLEDLAHALAGDRWMSGTEVASLDKVLTTLLDAQSRFGWKGLVTNFDITPVLSNAGRTSYALVDNATLTQSMMNAIGSLLRARENGLHDSAALNALMNKAKTFLDNQAEGYAAMVDPADGRFSSSVDIATGVPVRSGNFRDRIFAEDSAAILAIAQYFHLPMTVFTRLELAFRSYQMSDGANVTVAAPWKSPWQISWIVPYLKANPQFKIILENYAKAAMDFSKRNNMPLWHGAGFDGGGYNTDVGPPFNESGDVFTNHFSVFFVGSGLGQISDAARQAVLKWRKDTFAQVPALNTLDGPPDSIGRYLGQTFPTFRRYGINHGSDLIGMVGRQETSHRAFLQWAQIAQGYDAAIAAKANEIPVSALTPITTPYPLTPVIQPAPAVEVNFLQNIRELDGHRGAGIPTLVNGQLVLNGWTAPAGDFSFVDIDLNRPTNPASIDLSKYAFLEITIGSQAGDIVPYGFKVELLNQANAQIIPSVQTSAGLPAGQTRLLPGMTIRIPIVAAAGLTFLDEIRFVFEGGNVGPITSGTFRVSSMKLIPRSEMRVEIVGEIEASLRLELVKLISGVVKELAWIAKDDKGEAVIQITLGDEKKLTVTENKIEFVTNRGGIQSIADQFRSTLKAHLKKAPQFKLSGKNQPRGKRRVAVWVAGLVLAVAAGVVFLPRSDERQSALKSKIEKMAGKEQAVAQRLFSVASKIQNADERAQALVFVNQFSEVPRLDSKPLSPLSGAQPFARVMSNDQGIISWVMVNEDFALNFPEAIIRYILIHEGTHVGQDTLRALSQAANERLVSRRKELAQQGLANPEAILKSAEFQRLILEPLLITLESEWLAYQKEVGAFIRDNRQAGQEAFAQQLLHGLDDSPEGQRRLAVASKYIASVAVMVDPNTQLPSEEKVKAQQLLGWFTADWGLGGEETANMRVMISFLLQMAYTDLKDKGAIQITRNPRQPFQVKDPVAVWKWLREKQAELKISFSRSEMRLVEPEISSGDEAAVKAQLIAAGTVEGHTPQVLLRPTAKTAEAYLILGELGFVASISVEWAEKDAQDRLRRAIASQIKSAEIVSVTMNAGLLTVTAKTGKVWQFNYQRNRVGLDTSIYQGDVEAFMRGTRLAETKDAFLAALREGKFTLVEAELKRADKVYSVGFKIPDDSHLAVVLGKLGIEELSVISEAEAVRLEALGKETADAEAGVIREKEKLAGNLERVIAKLSEVLAGDVEGDDAALNRKIESINSKKGAVENAVAAINAQFSDDAYFSEKLASAAAIIQQANEKVDALQSQIKALQAAATLAAQQAEQRQAAAREKAVRRAKWQPIIRRSLFGVGGAALLGLVYFGIRTLFDNKKPAQPLASQVQPSALPVRDSISQEYTVAELAPERLAQRMDQLISVHNGEFSLSYPYPSNQIEITFSAAQSGYYYIDLPDSFSNSTIGSEKSEWKQIPSDRKVIITLPLGAIGIEKIKIFTSRASFSGLAKPREIPKRDSWGSISANAPYEPASFSARFVLVHEVKTEMLSNVNLVMGSGRVLRGYVQEEVLKLAAKNKINDLPAPSNWEIYFDGGAERFLNQAAVVKAGSYLFHVKEVLLPNSKVAQAVHGPYPFFGGGTHIYTVPRSSDGHGPQWFLTYIKGSSERFVFGYVDASFLGILRVHPAQTKIQVPQSVLDKMEKIAGGPADRSSNEPNLDQATGKSIIFYQRGNKHYVWDVSRFRNPRWTQNDVDTLQPIFKFFDADFFLASPNPTPQIAFYRGGQIFIYDFNNGSVQEHQIDVNLYQGTLDESGFKNARMELLTLRSFIKQYAEKMGWPASDKNLNLLAHRFAMLEPEANFSALVNALRPEVRRQAMPAGRQEARSEVRLKTANGEELPFRSESRLGKVTGAIVVAIALFGMFPVAAIAETVSYVRQLAGFVHSPEAASIQRAMRPEFDIKPDVSAPNKIYAVIAPGAAGNQVDLAGMEERLKTLPEGSVVTVVERTGDTTLSGKLSSLRLNLKIHREVVGSAQNVDAVIHQVLANIPEGFEGRTTLITDNATQAETFADQTMVAYIDWQSLVEKQAYEGAFSAVLGDTFTLVMADEAVRGNWARAKFNGLFWSFDGNWLEIRMEAARVVAQAA